jgi:hypothetical protein
VSRNPYAEKVRCYNVKTWTPPPPDAKSNWGSHWTYGVVALSAVDAMKVITEKHPDARIDAVNEVGIVSYISAVPKSGPAQP